MEEKEKKEYSRVSFRDDELGNAFFKAVEILKAKLPSDYSKDFSGGTLAKQLKYILEDYIIINNLHKK